MEVRACGTRTLGLVVVSNDLTSSLFLNDAISCWNEDAEFNMPVERNRRDRVMHGGLLRSSLDTGIHSVFGSAFLPFIQPAEDAYQGYYCQGTWVWLADHDLEAFDGPQLTIYSGRGILSESTGPVWMIGTGMHMLGVST